MKQFIFIISMLLLGCDSQVNRSLTQSLTEYRAANVYFKQVEVPKDCKVTSTSLTHTRQAFIVCEDGRLFYSDF